MQAIFEMGIDFDASFDLSGFDVVIKSHLCILQQLDRFFAACCHVYNGIFSEEGGV
ncbi:MAG TPA: hypothetical protein VKA91_04010 [Nitrososphaeraceae archaeon]|nr:hypothetical protein [Nitrososphaeraceae archaeon]